jgi:SAM-dependent methyltransferase
VPTRHQIVLAREFRWRRWLYRLLPQYQFSNDLYESLIKECLKRGTLWADLGCGKNELVHELAAPGEVAVGIDAAIHPNLNRATHPFILADAARLPFRPGSLDLISGNMMLEHLKDPRAAFRETHRALKGGGRLILRTPNSLHPLTLLARLLPGGLKRRLIEHIFGVASVDVFPTYYRANRPRELCSFCRNAGFTTPQIQSVEDVHTAYAFFFLPSLAYYMIVRLSRLAPFRSNFVLLATKDKTLEFRT